MHYRHGYYRTNFCRIWKCFAKNTKGYSQRRILHSEAFHTVYEKEFKVTPFCHLNINGAFKLNIKPLDFHKYVNYDKVIVKFAASTVNYKINPQCEAVEDVITVTSKGDTKSSNLICTVEAPVKASVQASIEKGSIHICDFHGDNLLLDTGNGDIIVENCYCDKIRLESIKGNIICKKVLQASEIYLKTGNFGSVSADKLLGTVLMVITENGSIKTQSCYCNDSTFVTENGEMMLTNIHRNCKAYIKKKGKLDLVRFDGSLEATINDGIANIQLSRIEDDSNILMNKNGAINLKLFESCQDNVHLKIIGKNISVDKNINMVQSQEEEALLLKCHNDKGKLINITGKESEISVQSASLTDLFAKIK